MLVGFSICVLGRGHVFFGMLVTTGLSLKYSLYSICIITQNVSLKIINNKTYQAINNQLTSHIKQ